MSPARVIHKENENELQTLTSALDALLVTTHQLSLREQDLQRRVRDAHDEVGFFFSFITLSLFIMMRIL